MEERSTVAVGAILAGCGGLFAIIVWKAVYDPPKKFDVQVYDAAAPIVDASVVTGEVDQNAMWAARDKLAKDRAGLQKTKPKTRADVEKFFGRPPDACSDTPEGQTYCLWYYTTKPVAEGRDQIGVTFDKKGKVVFLDN